jgi:CMP-2-keto-3-deoxyoctulosonic acid synthetase
VWHYLPKDRITCDVIRKLLRPTRLNLKKIESLEQLRVLHHGDKIGVTITQNAPASGVDTQEDLDFVISVFKDK